MAALLEATSQKKFEAENDSLAEDSNESDELSISSEDYRNILSFSNETELKRSFTVRSFGEEET